MLRDVRNEYLRDVADDLLTAHHDQQLDRELKHAPVLRAVVLHRGLGVGGVGRG